MSDAKKCDRCGAMYQVKKGVVALDVHIAKGDRDETWQGWSEVDFCPGCSQIILKAIGKAIQR
jgi:hypothetical protein